MPVQDRPRVQDEFQLELNRVRNSLNALTLKNFMFDGAARVDGGERNKKVEELPAVDLKTFPEASSERDEEFQSLEEASENVHAWRPLPVAFETHPEASQNFEDVSQSLLAQRPHPVAFKSFPKASSIRFEASTSFDESSRPSDVSRPLLVASQPLPEASSLSPEFPIESKPKTSRVHFGEAVEAEHKQKLLFKDPSRDSDEVATINNELPWQKKHQYRTVTPFLKQPSKMKAVSSENVSLDLAFRPIETSRSTEDITKQIIKPVPILAWKSVQELPASSEFKRFDHFQTKSSDDLLLSNIDGARKPESKRHMLMRIRSTSSTSLNRLSDQLVYENFHYDIPEVPANVIRRKAPQPLPRAAEDNKRHSKTLVYVLDKQRDEFVLESPEIGLDEVYEDVLLRNDVHRDSDSALFYSLYDSRDDCKFAAYPVTLQAQLVTAISIPPCSMSFPSKLFLFLFVQILSFALIKLLSSS